jgi:hypothetical protein
MSRFKFFDGLASEMHVNLTCLNAPLVSQPLPVIPVIVEGVRLFV